MNTIYRKEFRDIVRWTPIGIILIAVLGWMTRPTNIFAAVELERVFVSIIGLGCGLVALALGLLQSLLDQRTETSGYLIHRPISLGSIFWAKLLAGFTAYLICVVPTLVAMMIYLEWVGPERLPTSWVQVVPLFMMSLVIFVIHPAAMWATAREARWVGTRWFPLLFAIAGVYYSLNPLLSMHTIGGLAGFLLISVGTWVVVTSAAHHAFSHQVFSPPAASPNRMSLARAAVLLGASVLIMCGPSRLILMAPSDQSREGFFYGLGLRPSGVLWEIAQPYTVNRAGSFTLADDEHRLGRPLSGVGAIDPESASLSPLPDDWQQVSIVSQQDLKRGPGRWSHFNRNRITADLYMSDNGAVQVQLIDRQGRYYWYHQTQGLIACVTPDGFFRSDETPTGRFVNAQTVPILHADTRLLNITGQLFVLDSSGVFQLDFANYEIRRVLDSPSRLISLVAPNADQQATLWRYNDGLLQRYTFRPTDPDLTLPLADSEIILRNTHLYPMPSIEVELVDQWRIPPLEAFDRLGITEVDQGQIVTIRTPLSASADGRRRYTRYGADGTMVEDKVVQITVPVSEPAFQTALVSMPPVVVLGMALGRSIQYGERVSSAQLTDWFFGWWWPIYVAQGLAAAAIVVWLGSQRELTTRQRVLWAAIAMFGGFAAVLAVLAIYPRLLLEKCTHCDGRRRVDQRRCEHCGCDWDPPQLEGIEIIGGERIASPRLTLSV